jgi:hypothetical protein
MNKIFYVIVGIKYESHQNSARVPQPYNFGWSGSAASSTYVSIPIIPFPVPRTGLPETPGSSNQPEEADLRYAEPDPDLEGKQLPA